MVADHPATFEVFVVTSPGSVVDAQELCYASDLNKQRRYAALQICPKAGECAVKACYVTVEGDEQHNRVDRHFIKCDGDCALLSEQDDQSGH